MAPDITVIASDLSAPSTKEELVHWLESIIKNRLLLKGVAKRSYRHQLGFSKYVLAIGADGSALRMHHWDRSESTEEDIHSHCADFASTVWLGGFKEQTFILKNGETHALYSYIFNDQTEKSEAFRLRLSAVEKVSEKKVSAGDSYNVSALSLHRVSSVLPGTLTVSLWKPRSHSALVLKPKADLADPCCAVAGMDYLELQKKIELIIRRLCEE